MEARDLPIRPCEEDMAYIEKHVKWREYLIYKNAWIRDPLTGMKEQCAWTHCTACGHEEYFPKSYAESCHLTNAPAPFGIVAGRESKWDGQTMVCENCNSRVRLVHVSNIPRGINNEKWIMTAENVKGSAVLIGWILQREINKEGRELRSIKPYEAYEQAGKKLNKYCAYETYMRARMLTGVWEKRSRCVMTWYNSETVPMKPGIWNGTSAENSAMEEYLSGKEDRNDAVFYLWAWTRFKKLDALTRYAPELVYEMLSEECNRYYYSGGAPKLNYIDRTKTRPGEMLGLTREEIREAKQYGLDIIRIYGTARQHEKMKPEYLKTIFENKTTANVLDDSGRMMKGIRYIKKTGGSANVLRDYWRMAEGLGWEKTDAILWPKDLSKAHDRAVDECNRRREEKRIAADKETDRKIGERAKELAWTQWECNGIFIRPVEDLKDLFREGRLQNHCVSSYKDRIANGKTAILLIRKAEDPEKPYFTLEFDEEKLEVRQNRGNRNCDRTKEVEAFEQAWLEHIRQKVRKKTA